MTQLMQGKRGLIMGVANDHSIAWGIARMLAAHGATLAFSYQGEALGRRVKPLAESVGASLLLPCDVEQTDSLDAAFAAIGGQRSPKTSRIASISLTSPIGVEVACGLM